MSLSIRDAGVKAPVSLGSMWTPLRIKLFRALWIASLVSNIGLWMQTVGAQWLLVHQPHASILVALVQTADMLPDVMFALVAGVLADVFDRRRLLIIVQTTLAVIGTALAILTFANEMPPALLLSFTFLLGAGSAFSVPAYQALIPDLVPRVQLPSAASLSSVSINLARAVGPAIAGVLIARTGVGAVFALNAATFLFFALVVLFRRFPERSTPQFPERFGSAMLVGVRYVRHAPVVRRIFLRAALFLIPASALWALLPLVATQILGQGANGYGFSLGALGFGAVGGAFLLPTLRARMSINRLLVIASLVYASALVVLVLVHSFAVGLIVLVPAGVAWIAVLSSINAMLQLFLPAWVRARGLGMYQMVLFGTQALGAVLWGVVAGPAGLTVTFLIASAAIVVGAATLAVWPFFDTGGMDRSLAVYWPEPQLVFEPEPDSGPVVVTSHYSIAPSREEEFLRAMKRVRQSRLRTGAIEWGLFRDGEQANRFVEIFVVPSWEEHLRQHVDRLTGTDRQFQEEANAFSDPPPEVSHLLSSTFPD